MRSNERWWLGYNWENKVKISASGMTVFTLEKGGTSVGYSDNQRLEHLRLLSAAPELENLVNIAKRLLNSDNLEDWQVSNFNQEFELVKNKINGLGKLKRPNHCRFTYEWKDEHIEDYHKKVQKLRNKL